jgi:hypothetical protein
VVNVNDKKFLKILLDEEDQEDLKELILYTLWKLSVIVDKHLGIIDKNTVGMWRCFADELLMIYQVNLSKVHLESMNEAIRKFLEESEKVESK